MKAAMRIPLPTSRCSHSARRSAASWTRKNQPTASSSSSDLTREPANESGSNLTKRPSSEQTPLESSTMRIFSHTGTVIMPTRPAVRPPPTLVLPPSMSSLKPNSPIPPNKGKVKVKGKAKPTVETAEPDPNGLWTLYQDSLAETNTEPTLEDLAALRPKPSTIRAALEGTVGAGRTLLPETHQLYLDHEFLGAEEAPVGGGPRAKKKIIAGTRKAKKIEYRALYEATKNALNLRFTVAQLRRFAEVLRLKGVGKAATKAKLMDKIMNDQFRMIDPQVLADDMAEVMDRVEEFYDVSPSELFILLGPDGEHLINISKRLKMDISMEKERPSKSSTSKSPKSASEGSKPVSVDSKPRDTSRRGSHFVLRAVGVKADHKQFKKHLDELKKSINVRMVTLPAGSPLPKLKLQSISRMADAFCENVHPELRTLEPDEAARPAVLITARDARSAYTAERLVQRAVLEDIYRARIPILSLAPPFNSDSNDQPQEYAMYPYDTERYRLQHIKKLKRLPEQDAPAVHFQYKHKPTPMIDRPNSPVVEIDSELDVWETRTPTAEQPADLYQLVCNGEHLVEGQTHKVWATLGHVLFKSEDPSLKCPLPSPVRLLDALKLSVERPAAVRSFVPGMAPPLVRLMPRSTKSIHRLQYRTIDGGHIVDVDVELPGEQEENVTRESGCGHDPQDQLELTGERTGGEQNGLTLTGANEGFPTVKSRFESRGESEETHDAEVVPAPLVSEISIGTDTAVEVAIPDGTMDMSVRASSTSPLGLAQVPEPLQTYLNELAKFFTTDLDMFQPDPPQSFIIDDRRYVLVKNTSGRQGIAPVIFGNRDLTVTVETALDLENNVRTAFTEIFYDTSSGSKGWITFLRMCQSLATKPYEQALNQAGPSVL